MAHVYSVREITAHIRDVLGAEFPEIWVRGEVGNLSRPSSGHLYFSLKDADALINVVWFKGAQRSHRFAEAGDPDIDAETGEVLEAGPFTPDKLQNGREMVVLGRLDVYPPRGGYQLIARFVQESGRGRLWELFEALKTKLTAEGFFDQARKRPIPPNPTRIALIAATSGAAVHDFLRVAESRGFGSTIRLHPTPAQGVGAAEKIAAAVRAAGASGFPQVVVVIRGGGSLEDLWSYNEEIVARAIFESPVPVLAGVGHEVDFTLADLTADLRAATPTHAAGLLWTDRDQFAQEIDAAETALARAVGRKLSLAEAALAEIVGRLGRSSPVARLAEKRRTLDDLVARLHRAHDGARTRREERAADLTDRLLAKGSTLLDAPTADHTQLMVRLQAAILGRLLTSGHALDLLNARLAAHSPLGPLDRGFALVRDGRGRVLQSAKNVNPGDPLSLTMRDGEVAVRAESVQPSHRP